MIDKQIIIDKIEVLEMGQIWVRTATKIIEDGIETSRYFHRHVITPDHADLSDQDLKVQAIANVVWTDDVKQNWQTFIDTQTEGK